MWKTFVYDPWAAAQFGPLALKGVQVSGGDSTAATFRGLHDLPLVMMDVQSINHDQVLTGDLGTTKRQAEWQSVVQVVTDPANSAAWGNFTGNNTGSRLSIALVNFFGLIFAAFPMMFIAFTLIFQQLMFVFLLIMAPLYALIGINPGPGRRAAMGWVEMVLGTAIKRLVNYVLFAVMLAMSSAVTASAIAGGAIIQILLMGGVSFGILAYRKRIVDRFSTVNLGGQQMGGAGEAKRTGKQLKGILAGAVAGAAGAHMEEESILKGAAKGGFRGNREGGSIRQAFGATQAAVRKAGDRGKPEDVPLTPEQERELAERARAEAEQGYRLREDQNMDAGRATADEWAAWSARNANRPVPRPNDPNLAAELARRNIPIRDRVGEMVAPDAAAPAPSGPTRPSVTDYARANAIRQNQTEGGQAPTPGEGA